MTLLLNILNNIWFSTYSLYIYSFIDNSQIETYKTLLCISGIYYFIYDSVLEIYLHKRLVYIPHHMFSLVGFYMIQNVIIPYDLLRIYILLLGLLESTSLMVNVRIILKNNKRLSITLDKYFLLYYTLIRCVIYPYYLYYYFENQLLLTCSWSIYLMSLYWTIKWSKNIYKVTHSMKLDKPI